MSGATVLDDAHAACRNLFIDPMVQQDHAIGEVFFEAVAGERAVAALGGDDGGEIAVIQPAEQAAQFRSQNRCVG